MLSKSLSLNAPVSLSATAEILIFAGLSAAAFGIPFSLGQPQWLVGTAVNGFLFLAAIFLPKKFILPLVIFPGLGVLSRGLIFGPLTMFLVYFLPFIWLGNLALILVFKILFSRVNYFFAIVFSAMAKFLLLFAAVNICFSFALVPKVFTQLMGLNQLATALAGGAISWLIFNLYAKHNSRSKRTT